MIVDGREAGEKYRHLLGLLTDGRVGLYKSITEDKFSKKVNKALDADELTRWGAWLLIEALYPLMHQEVKDALNGRMDHRSSGTFYLTVRDATKRERYIAIDETLPMLKSIGMIDDWDIEPLGLDNDGCLVLDPERIRKNGGKPDFKIFAKGCPLLPKHWRPLEVKFDKSIGIYTLKEKDVKMADDGCFILCVWCDDHVVGLEGHAYATRAEEDAAMSLPHDKAYWSIQSPDSIRALAADHRAKRVGRYMGNKRGYPILHKDFHRYFVLEKWGQCSQRNGLARPWEDKK